MKLASSLFFTIGALTLLAAFSPARAQWIQQFGTSSNDEIRAVATDSAGNLFATGFASGAVLGQSGSGAEDAVVAKYDSAGGLVWAREFGTSSSDFAYSLARVGSGIVVGGTTPGTLPGQTSSGSNDAFVRLYDDTGTTLWTKQVGTVDSDVVNGVAADGFGHIIAVGWTAGAFSGFSSAGSTDLFVMQLNASTGAILWTRQFGSSGLDLAQAVAVDSSGNIFVGGDAGGPLSGQTHAGGTDGFVMKLNSSGTALWTHQFGTSGTDHVYGLAVDSGGDAIAGGSTAGTLPGQVSLGGVFDAFARKLYGNDGTALWTTQFGTAGTDEVEDVAVNSAGQVLVGGYTNSTLQGQTSAGGEDGFIQGLNTDGSTILTEQFGTSGNDQVLGVALDANSQIFAGGRTRGSFPGFTNAGITDDFVTKRPAALPEPTVATLLLLGAAGVLAQRRRGGVPSVLVDV